MLSLQNNVFAQPKLLTVFHIRLAVFSEIIIDAISDIPDILSVAYDVLEDTNLIKLYVDKADISFAQMQAYLAAIEATYSVGLQLEDCFEIEDIDWVLHAQQATNVQKIASIVIAGSHHQAHEIPQGKLIQLDAGAAFGTGEHGTTHGCVVAICEVMKNHHAQTILDMGCGTALLAMVAAKLNPAAQVVAVDNDKVAVKVAQENIRKNQLHNNIVAKVGNGFHTPIIHGNKYDLIIANILAQPVRAMAGAMNQHLELGGMLILSGFYQRDVRKVFARFQSRGFHIHKIIKIREWAILILCKNVNNA